ncbi:hypothetical protein PR048_020689 [Dryococelus australis]|uniref:Uncharacterized protein n=1 Tax=Dryococelus australis TaxID=614101 RepID=A0ABQ9H6Z8_9NEOP|nr:hypothetical protein PR048_020689 [Dryococelus australis]
MNYERNIVARIKRVVYSMTVTQSKLNFSSSEEQLVWKHIGNMTTKHENSNVRKLSLPKYQGWLETRQSRPATVQINDHLNNMPQNAKYSSNIIQNDMLEAASSVITQDIVREIKSGRTLYILIFDEAHEWLTEQMSTCIRYLHGTEITDVSQSFDGASFVGETIGLLEAIYAFQCSSTLCHNVFMKSQISCGMDKLNVQHSDTGWVSKYKGTVYISSNYISTVLLQHWQNHEDERRCRSKGSVYFVSLFVLILSSCWFALLNANSLLLHLQSPNLDFRPCLKLIESTIEEIAHL